MSIEKMESKLARELSRVAILLELSREKDGIHAYALLERVQNTIFSARKMRSDEVNRLKRIILDVIDGKGNISDIHDHPVLRYNTSLLKVQAGKGNDKSVKYLTELYDKIILAEKAADLNQKIWKSVSGLYNVISQLEDIRAVKMKSEEIVNGRVQKIFVITAIGHDFLKKSILLLSEIMSFTTNHTNLINFDGDDTNQPLGEVTKLLFKDLSNPVTHIKRKLKGDISFTGLLNEILSDPKFHLMVENIIPMGYLDTMMLRDDNSFLSLVDVYLSGFKRDVVVKSILWTRVRRMRDRLDQVDKLIDDL